MAFGVPRSSSQEARPRACAGKIPRSCWAGSGGLRGQERRHEGPGIVGASSKAGVGVLSHGSVIASYLSAALRGLKQKRKRMLQAGGRSPDGLRSTLPQGRALHALLARGALAGHCSADGHGPAAAPGLSSPRPPRLTAAAVTPPTAGDAG